MIFDRLENLRFDHSSENPAYRALENLRRWCEEKGLGRETVKIITGLDDIFRMTPLGHLVGIEPDPSFFTLAEKEIQKKLLEGGEKVEILVVLDIDGVLVSIWPPLDRFFKIYKENPTISPSEVKEMIERAVAQTRPPWTAYRSLGKLLRRADYTLVWSNRIPIKRENPLWRLFLSALFAEPSPPLLDRFPFITDENIRRIERKFGGKIRVLSDWPKRASPIISQIEKMKNPYSLIIGSSIFDIRLFRKVVDSLLEEQFPFVPTFISTNRFLQ